MGVPEVRRTMQRHNWDYRAVLLVVFLSCGTAFAQGTPSAVIGGPPAAGTITGIVQPANGGTGINNGTNTLTFTNEGTLSPLINVKDAAYGGGAKGDTVAISGNCSITATLFVLSCPSAAFASSDVGKYAVVHGAGAAGAALVTTIAGFTDANDVTLTASASTTTSTAAHTLYGTDDSAAVAAAVAAGVSAQACVYFPHGSYGLYSRATKIVLSTVCLRGDPARADRTPYTNIGSVILVFNQSTPTFAIEGLQIAIRDMSFFWPAQDGVASASFTASQSTTTLTVTGSPVGTLAVGQVVVGAGVGGLETITGLGSGTGGAGTYTVSESATISSEAMTSFAPIVYPALFDTDAAVNAGRMTIEDVQFINPYVLFQTDAASNGLGTLRFDSIDSYCIFHCFNILSGNLALNYIGSWLDSTNTYTTEATSGNAYLARWSAAFGTFLTQDTAGGVTTPSLWQINGLYVYGKWAGLQFTSGSAAWSLPLYSSDGVQSAMVFDGSATANLNWGSGYVWSENPYDASQTQPGIYGNGTGHAVNLTIGSGVQMLAAYGSNLIDSSGTTFGSVVLNGPTITNWGQSSTAGTYYGVRISSASAALQVTGAHFLTIPKGGNTLACISAATMLSFEADSNWFFACSSAISLGPAANSRYVTQGNVSRSTSGTTSLAFAAGAATASKAVVDDNLWDKPLPSTIASGFGSGSTISCALDWKGCAITVGTIPGTTGILNLPWTLNAAPVCIANDSTTALSLTVSTSTTQVTVGGAVVAGDIVNVTCRGA